MTIHTKYDIMDKVMFMCYRSKEPQYICGEIQSIHIYKNGFVKYRIQYLLSGELFTADVWEEDIKQS